MVNVLFALPATVGALIGTGLLISRTFNQRLPHLVAWCITMVGLSLALGAMTVGFLAGFNSLLFRVAEFGGALIAPAWLVLGVVELIAYHVQVRFTAWLFTVSYSIVAAVVVLLDPLTGTFGKDLPKPDDHYEFLPLTLISVAHVVVVIGLVVCAAATALRARRDDGAAYDVLVPVALSALAGVLVVAGTRGLLPGFAAVIALGAAVGLIWFGGVRTTPPITGDEEDMRDDHYGYGEQPRRAEPPQERPMPPRSAAGMGGPAMAGPSPAYADAPLGAPTGMGYAPAPEPIAPPQLYGQITVYTLLDGREEAFDRLAAEAVRAAREGEPDTLMYICHVVVNSPTQRIFYQLFRDEAAYRNHRRLPQVQRFAADSRTHVLAVNVVELKVNDAKVAPSPSLAGQDYF